MKIGFVQFIDEFIKRLEQLEQTLENSNWTEKSIYLGNFNYPEAFLAAT